MFTKNTNSLNLNLKFEKHIQLDGIEIKNTDKDTYITVRKKLGRT